jgi:KaiC/GvpD/RAD55 family RecA-like ATPase
MEKLIEGEPGTGKTTLALQFLLEGARRGEAVLYVTLSETKNELINVAALARLVARRRDDLRADSFRESSSRIAIHDFSPVGNRIERNDERDSARSRAH